MPFALDIPHHRDKFDTLMEKILINPTSKKEFMGMTYLYHSDALNYPNPHYNKFITPFLVVGGALDPSIQSFDLFVKNTQKTNVPVTYFRIENMNH